MDSETIGIEIAVMNSRLKATEAAIEKIADSLSILSGIEARHENTEKKLIEIGDKIMKIEDVFHSLCREKEARLAEIEKQMPALNLIKTWVIAGVLGLMGLVGTAIVHTVIYK